ncbi:MAG: prephenate dehydratase [Planctomycetia bacterium]|jgi:chorismate mutase/prephenate dehydratase
MAKKKTSKKTTTKTAPKMTPAKLQQELRRTDRELVTLLQKHVEVARQLGQLQIEAGGAPFDPHQEEEFIEVAVARATEPLDPEVVRAIFRELSSGARASLHRLRIAHLGPQHSYSHLAAIEYFGQSVEFQPVATIRSVFEEVQNGQADFGIVPLENSTDGRVSDTLDMFTKLHVRICGEVNLPIQHALMANCAREEVKEVRSKPQALSQCRGWLAEHVPGAKLVNVSSTSDAARAASEEKGVAAVASVQAGTFFGLDILAENIADNPLNTTRFSVIGSETARRTGNDKTAIMYQLEDKAGALATSLGIFRRNQLNLTWIESFPIPGEDRAYLFFIELEGHENDVRVRRAIESLQKKTIQLKVLGSFASS